MRLLFWNTHRNNDINKYLASLVQDYKVDILIVSEYTADENELHELLVAREVPLQKCNTIGCDRIQMWSNYANIKAGMQDNYFSIQLINDEIILCATHLFTDLNGDSSEERSVVAAQMIAEIDTLGESSSSSKSIIIGDLNDMPYSKMCLNANVLHALPALNMDDSTTRTVRGTTYRKYYNPMWNLFGDFSYPPGTYYLNKSSLYAPMWYMFDQVIISQDVIPQFNKESLKIITACSYSDLKDKNFHPNKNISDHFPIFCEIVD